MTPFDDDNDDDPNNRYNNNNINNDDIRVRVSSPLSDDLAVANEFDNATYGLWSTIMNSPKINYHGFESQQLGHQLDVSISTFPISSSPDNQNNINQHNFIQNNTSSSSLKLLSRNQIDCIIQPQRQERLEEFVSAFLGLSVFDLADVWVPITADVDGSVCTLLHNVFCISSTDTVNDDNSSGDIGGSSGGVTPITHFKHVSRNTVIKGWAGAVGRAQCSGNAVWSTNPVREAMN